MNVRSAVRNAPIAETKEPESKGSRVRQLWIGLWWWLLMPFDCIDLKTGLPRYDRMVPLAIVVVFGIKTLRETGWPPTLIVIAILAAIFGADMFTKFLVRAKLGATSLDMTQTVKVSAEPNLFTDDESGEEPNRRGRVGQ